MLTKTDPLAPRRKILLDGSNPQPISPKRSRSVANFPYRFVSLSGGFAFPYIVATDCASWACSRCYNYWVPSPLASGVSRHSPVV